MSQMASQGRRGASSLLISLVLAGCAGAPPPDEARDETVEQQRARELTARCRTWSAACGMRGSECDAIAGMDAGKLVKAERCLGDGEPSRCDPVHLCLQADGLFPANAASPEER